MDTDAYKSYQKWLGTLDVSEFENERYTIRNEWHLIGMDAIEAADKKAACDDDAARRSIAFMGASHE